MAKPICVVYYYPENLAGAGGKIPSIYDMNEVIERKFSDYHTLAIPSTQSLDGSCEDLRVQVYNSENATEIDFDQFKKEILESLAAVG